VRHNKIQISVTNGRIYYPSALSYSARLNVYWANDDVLLNVTIARNLGIEVDHNSGSRLVCGNASSPRQKKTFLRAKQQQWGFAR
jgi:hypothetical protein